MRPAEKTDGYFAACAGLQLRMAAKRLPGLVAMALAALLLSGLVAVLLPRLLGSGQEFGGFTIAIASEEDEPYIELVVELLERRPDVRSFATINRVRADEAEELVRGGKATVAVVFPAGFVQGVLSGENLPPRLVVDASRPLETMLTAKLAENAAAMLARAQQGIGYTLTTLGQQPGQADVGAAMMDINLAYATWVLGRSSMFRSTTVNATGLLGVVQHYLLSAVVFFAFLCIPVLYRVYSLHSQNGWLRRMRGAGCPMWAWALCQILAGALMLLAALVLLLFGIYLAGGEGAVPSLLVLPSLILCALFLSAAGFLCCNTGSVLGSVSLVFLLALVGVLAFGGIIPLVLLPGPLAALAPFSPLGWMYDVLAPLFGVPMAWGSFAALAALAAALFAGALLLAARAERRGVA